MTTPLPFALHPELDLMIERVIDVPPHHVWRARTEPAHLMPWLAPKPWSVVHCEIDLRAGGIFATTMRSPEGEVTREKHETMGFSTGWNAALDQLIAHAATM